MAGCGRIWPLLAVLTEYPPGAGVGATDGVDAVDDAMGGFMDGSVEGRVLLYSGGAREAASV